MKNRTSLLMRRAARGFSMIELLVAVLVMGIGVLGITGLQMVSLQNNRGALTRADAVQLAYDMLDRMRANPGAAYAGLFLTEGTGLLFRKRWAEWLTIVATSSLMPIEVYELVKKFTAVRLVALLINAVVVLYLIYLVRQKQNGGLR